MSRKAINQSKSQVSMWSIYICFVPKSKIHPQRPQSKSPRYVAPISHSIITTHSKRPVQIHLKSALYAVEKTMAHKSTSKKAEINLILRHTVHPFYEKRKAVKNSNFQIQSCPNVYTRDHLHLALISTPLRDQPVYCNNSRCLQKKILSPLLHTKGAGIESQLTQSPG